MNQARELHAGDELGGYQLVRKLGAGGTGQVWEVHDAGGNAYALKLLHAGLAADETYRQRILREAQLLARLESPGVVAVCDFEVDAAESFIVTELVRGQNLSDLVRETGALPTGEALSLAQQLLNTLDTVHAAGIVHRDFKPSNILLGNNGPVLIDFGIAQAEADERFTATGLVSGTPGWVSPEVIAGRTPDILADQWGWAATLLYMLTGRAPYGTGSWEAVLSRVASGQVDTAGLPPAIAQVFQRALGPVGQRMPARALLDYLQATWSAYQQQADATEPLAGLPAELAATQVAGGFAGGSEQTLIFPEGATELLPQTTPPPGTSLPSEPPTQLLSPSGTSLHFPAPDQGNQATTPFSPQGTSLVFPDTEAPQPQLVAKPRTPIITAPLFYLTLALIPPLFGVVGIGSFLLLLLALSLVGYHRKYLRQRLSTYLELKTADHLLAILRTPIHLLQAALGLLASVGLIQLSITLGWYLYGENQGWDGVEFYRAISLRTTTYLPAEIVPPQLTQYYPLLLVAGWALAMLTCLLGPTGKELNEGTSLLLTRVIPIKTLRLAVVILSLVGLGYWGAKLFGVI